MSAVSSILEWPAGVKRPASPTYCDCPGIPSFELFDPFNVADATVLEGNDQFAGKTVIDQFQFAHDTGYGLLTDGDGCSVVCPGFPPSGGLSLKLRLKAQYFRNGHKIRFLPFGTMSSEEKNPHQ